MKKKEAHLLDVKIVDNFCKKWIGSGDINANVVFLGVEFSSEARSEKTIKSFFNEIVNLKTPQIIKDYTQFVTAHSRNHDKLFHFETSKFGANNITRQGMSLMAYSLLNKSCPITSELNHHTEFLNWKTQFANNKSNTASLELYALPCVSESESDYKYIINGWIDSSKYPHFETKKAYREYYSKFREKLIKAFIAKESVKYVFVYSKANREKIASLFDFTLNAPVRITGLSKSYYYIKKDGKHFIIMDHFCSRGVRYEYWNSIIKHLINKGTK